MADGVPLIPECKPGGDSLVSAAYANKIIIPLNGILQGRVAPIAGVGSFKYAGGMFILDLSLFDQRVRALESGTSANTQDQIDAINNRLDNATINGSGECMGNNISINISLNI